MAPPTMPSDEFELKTIEVEKVGAAVPNDTLLELYGLFKIATNADFKTAPKPGMFDLKGKAKYRAWEQEVESGTNRAAAAQKYVAKVNELGKQHGMDPARTERVNGQPIEKEKLQRYDVLKQKLAKK